MAKKRDIQPELYEFNSVFEKLSSRHTYSTVFTDTLIIFTAFFARDEMKEEQLNTWKRYSEAEQYYFDQLLKIWIKEFDKQITAGKVWFDFFGSYYEELTSRGKSSALGQFFTPETIVDLMVMLQYGGVGIGKRINDPACGSGRMPIAFHSYNPGNYIVAEDIDRTCCLMTCLNMMMHGCSGEVIWHNSLNPDTFYGGWHINNDIYQTNIPSILPMKYDEKQWKERNKQVFSEQKPAPSVVTTQPTTNVKPSRLIFRKSSESQGKVQ